jgi:hypothetical protein
MAEVKPKTNRGNRAMRRVRMWVVVVLALLGGKYWLQNRDVTYAQPNATPVAAPAAPQATFGDKVAAVADGAVLDLAVVEPSDWETVHVVGPYASAAALQQRLGFAVPMASAVCTTDEGRQSLLFVRGTEVVAWHALPRSRGDFCRPPANERGVARAEARFVATKAAAVGGWRTFELQPR